MQNNVPDRETLSGLSDDNCIQLPDWALDSKVHDLSELWCDLGGS